VVFAKSLDKTLFCTPRTPDRHSSRSHADGAMRHVRGTRSARTTRFFL
jgi:hypothetical protein